MVLERVSDVGLICAEVFIEKLGTRGLLDFGELHDRLVVVDLLILLYRHLLWLGEKASRNLRDSLGHRILVEAFLQEYLFLGQCIAINNHVVLRGPGRLLCHLYSSSRL